MPSSSLSKIAVLQSLPHGEMQTGRRVFEDLQPLNVFYGRGLTIQFYDVPTKAKFLAALSQLATDAANGIYPLLHIDCHGATDQTGIVLGDGSFLPWSDLKPYFISINVATRCNLLIVLAACYGGYLAQILLPTDRAPCWG